MFPFFLPDTKVDLQDDQKTADILGVSAVVVADLIHKRQKDYTFNWESARSVRIFNFKNISPERTPNSLDFYRFIFSIDDWEYGSSTAIYPLQIDEP